MSLDIVHTKVRAAFVLSEAFLGMFVWVNFLTLAAIGWKDTETIILEDALRECVGIYKVSFQELANTSEDDKVLLKADLCVTDPPYNVRSETGKRGSTHDMYTKKWDWNARG